MDVEGTDGIVVFLYAVKGIKNKSGAEGIRGAGSYQTM